MNQSGVPESVEALVSGYDRLITWEINRVTRGRLQGHEVDDLRQQVYLRVVEKDFLGRCRAYYADTEGRFSTSLVRLVRNVAINQLAANTRNPLQRPLRHAVCTDSGMEVNPLDRLAHCDRHEAALLARDTIEYLGAQLDNPQQKVLASAVLRAAIDHGPRSVEIAEELHTRPGTVRFYLHRARKAARTLGATA